MHTHKQKIFDLCEFKYTDPILETVVAAPKKPFPPIYGIGVAKMNYGLSNHLTESEVLNGLSSAIYLALNDGISAEAPDHERVMVCVTTS